MILIDGVLIVMGTLPVSVMVTVCAGLVVFTVWLVNVSNEGEGFTVGIAAMLVPFNATVCGLLVSSKPLTVLLSVKVSVPVSLGVVDGVNVTPTVQVAPGAIEPLQVFAGGAKIHRCARWR